MSTRQRLVVLGLIGLAVASASAQDRKGGRRRPRPVPQNGDAVLRIELKEGSDGQEGDSGDRPKAAEATPLTDAEAQKVLGRLSPLEPEAGADFALRESSLPPPRTGKTVSDPFPPPKAPRVPDATEAGPLSVLRHMPDGEVPLAPHFSVTFSQPMVAVTSHDDTLKGGVPVKLSPEVPGAWRWLGTKTLLFEPQKRFPMATKFTAEIPAGTTSATGGKLEKEERFTFSTPPPQVVSFYPLGGPQRRDPLLYAAFDQAIDADAVLATIQVKDSSGRVYPIKLVDGEPVSKDPVVHTLASSCEAGRWLAFRSTELFPTDTEISVVVGPNTPSAEGPRKTDKAQTSAFKTYGPLKLVRQWPPAGQEQPPYGGWSLEFTNPIDTDSFKKDLVKIEPELPGAKVAVSGNYVQIYGATKGRTTYKVTVGSALADTFGNTLGHDETAEFKVGSAGESFSGQQGLIVLDPSAPPRYSLYCVNEKKLRLRVWSVTPESWSSFHTMNQNWNQNRVLAEPRGKLAIEKEIKPEGAPDELAETRIDLSEALDSGLGHAILVIEPTTQPKEQWQRRALIVWVEATGIGLDAFVDHEKLLGWASSLKDGKPLEGVSLSIAPSSATGTTATDGLASIGLPESLPDGACLVAKKGKDTALLPERTWWWGGGSAWQKRPVPDEYLRWYVADDRHMYRPGEDVHAKGWIRRVGYGPAGDVHGLDGVAKKVSFRVVDSRGNELTKGEKAINAAGGFDIAFSLPKTVNLGWTSLQLTADGGPNNVYHHGFEVQEFRRPEFEVTAQASEGPHLVGGSGTASVSASYYAGGGLPGAEVTWNVSAQAGHFTPPNRGDFTFGTWVPWWEYSGDFSPGAWAQHQARTDVSGKHRLAIEFQSMPKPRAVTVTAQATVMDVNRQAWSATASFLVHPAELYVGLKSPRCFVQKGEPLNVDAIVCDLDGNAVPGTQIALRAVRLDWAFENGSWQQKEEDPQEVNLDSGKDPARATFATKEGGTYKVTAQIRDKKERENESQLTLWVAGGKQPPSRSVQQEKVTLIPDKQTYKPGETAEILVQAPFAPAEGLITLRREGLASTERFSLTGPSTTIKVKIAESHVPNVHVQVDLVGSAVRTTDAGVADPKLAPRPAFASGTLDLAVPPLSRTLALETKPRDAALEPGGETTIDVTLKDASGKPVPGGEVAVVVVDESVLSLSGYRLPDPVATFYTQRGTGVADHHLRAHVVLSNPEDVVPEANDHDELKKAQFGGGKGGAPGAPPADAARARRGTDKAEELGAKDAAAGEPANSGGSTPIKMRSEFAALATFAAELPTDANGTAQVKVKLPDTLTRYRVMAVAVSGSREFGHSEATITARLPLMVRPSPPRFLNFGDRFELPVVLQNQTDTAMDVDVAVRAANATITAGAGRRVRVPANDRVEVRFPSAAARAGTAHFQIGAASGKWADAAEIKLPVWTPATTEAFATYGEIDDGAMVQPVKMPGDVVKEFGGLEITTSSTQLQALTDAVIYLVSYPFECAEQLSSRVLAVAALKDVLTAFDAAGLPKPEEMTAAVARDLARLQGMQNDDGGFGFWHRGEREWPYLGIHVAHALARAKQKGFEVPAPMLERSHGYLKTIEAHIPSDYSPDCRRSLQAYALYVRNLLGDADWKKARSVIKDAGGVEKMGLETLGWLLTVLDAAPRRDELEEIDLIRRHLGNRVSEEAGTAHFTTSYGEQSYVLLHSDRRTDGVLLEALIGDDPKNDLIPKIVRGLLAHRTAGRWGNTQENAFILLALDRYFRTYEKETPDFVARMWLGDRFAGEHAWKGRSTDRNLVSIPMSYLASGDASKDLALTKEGTGRLYYRIGMRYAPSSLQLEPSEHGFTVTRSYEAVEKPEDVRRDADGVWHVKAGAKVRVRLSMVATARRYHVALVDPLPAGLEAMNPSLAVTGNVPEDPRDSAKGGYWWWRWTWYEHQNLRDERAEAFTSLLWEGVHSYTYVARATTPGTFVVPPAKAEEMYAPETFGRSGSDKLVVE